MIPLSSWSCLCPIHWSQVLSRGWRCSWSSADRRCSNYIWVINNFIAWVVTYIRGLTVPSENCILCTGMVWKVFATDDVGSAMISSLTEDLLYVTFFLDSTLDMKRTPLLALDFSLCRRYIIVAGMLSDHCWSICAKLQYSVYRALS